MPLHSKKGRIPHQAQRRGRAGETNTVPGKECLYQAPAAKGPNDVFGLQLTAPSSSISQDFKNKDRSSWQPAAESSSLPPRESKRNESE